VTGDFDGDRKSDLAIFRPATGEWYRLFSNGGYDAFRFGLEGDAPAVRDFDGDGRADVTVWRPGSGTWYSIDSADGEFSAVNWGANGDVPVPADYNGDGRSERSVFRNGTWYSLFSGGNHSIAQFGLAGDIPAPKAE
jgi:hypothetical protein